MQKENKINITADQVKLSNDGSWESISREHCLNQCQKRVKCVIQDVICSSIENIVC